MRKLVIFALLFLLVAAPAYDVNVSWINAGTMTQHTGSSFSGSYTVSSSCTPNCVAVAVVGFDNQTGISITSVTYNGVAMTSCGTASVSTASGAQAAIYALPSPHTGANTLAVTGSTSPAVTETYVNLVSFNNANQTTPCRSGTYITSNGTTATATQTITSATTDLTVGVINSGNAGIASTYTTQTGDGSSNAGNLGAASDHATTAAATITDKFTLNGTTDGWALAGVSIEVAASSSSNACTLTTLRAGPC